MPGFRHIINAGAHVYSICTLTYIWIDVLFKLWIWEILSEIAIQLIHNNATYWHSLSVGHMVVSSVEVHLKYRLECVGEIRMLCAWPCIWNNWCLHGDRVSVVVLGGNPTWEHSNVKRACPKASEGKAIVPEVMISLQELNENSCQVSNWMNLRMGALLNL